MLTLFFVDNLPTNIGANYEFTNEDADHAIRVLRMKAGDIFALSDGKGAWSHVKATDVGKKAMKVEVIETGFQESLDTHITVIQAIPKGDRLKESIELITESGADRIIIWSAHRSIGKSDKGIEKLVRTAREASKQSRRYRIPEICGAISSKNIIDEIGKSDLAIVFHESALSKLSDIVNTPAKKILVIIGPEGGITDAELELFAGAGAKVALLGRPILRSAHAGLAAVSAVNALLKVW